MIPTGRCAPPPTAMRAKSARPGCRRASSTRRRGSEPRRDIAAQRRHQRQGATAKDQPSSWALAAERRAAHRRATRRLEVAVTVRLISLTSPRQGAPPSGKVHPALFLALPAVLVVLDVCLRDTAAPLACARRKGMGECRAISPAVRIRSTVGGAGRQARQGGRRVTTQRRRLGPRLRAYLIAGILVTAPIAVTLTLAWWFVEFIDSQVLPLLPARYNPETWLPFAVPGLGPRPRRRRPDARRHDHRRASPAASSSAPARACSTACRWCAASIAATKQILHAVFAEGSDAFRQAVAIQFPARGCGSSASSPRPPAARSATSSTRRPSASSSPPCPTPSPASS